MRSIVLLSACLLPLCCVSITSTLIAQESPPKWDDLFDGQSLQGWTQKGGKAEYKVEDGMIVGTTVPNTPNSFLCTVKEYGNFDLQLEFKVHPELNSGIQVRSISDPEIKDGRVHGYQVEIDPSIRSWSCGIYDEGRRGWLYELGDKPAARYAFRQNEWNQYRIVAIGDSIQTWINGVPAADLKDDMTPKGFIALQVHGVGGRKDPIDVRWRNIRLAELPDGFAFSTDAGPVNDAPRDHEYNVQVHSKDFTFTEGPAMGPDGRVYFSDIPNEKIHVFDPETSKISEHRSSSGKSNGLVWTPHDALLACEGGARRVSIQLQDGSIKTVVDQFDGKKLNSPNDITLDGVGGFYFTDPRYGNRDDMEMEVEGVYYVDRGRKITRVVDDIERPNGIELSNDGRTLYVADTGSGSVFAYEVAGPGKISNKREFVEMGSDGMTIDENDCLYITNGNAVHVYSAAGEFQHKIEFPSNPANVTFGGADRKTLFVTARTDFYSVPMPVAGSRVYANPKE